MDRSAAMNALDGPMIERIVERLAMWESDPEVRVVVITGTGRAFCAGADLRQVLDSVDGNASALLEIGSRFYASLRRFPKPMIGAVNGVALAGGLELLLACDIVIGCESARFGDGHANYGVMPGGGSTALLPHVLPPNVAKYLLFSGATCSAREMHAWGFVNEVVADDKLAERVRQLADGLAAKSPLVLSRMKALVNAAADRSLEDALEHEQQALAAHMGSEDFREGLEAFRARRAPVFEGR